jgi:protein-disulfide isomerase
MRKILLAILTVMLLIVAGCGKSPNATGGAVAFSGEKVKLDLYVMSQCPYGVQVEDELGLVFEKIGNAVELNLQYIGDGTESNLQSLHGEPEVKGDISQLCAKKYSPDNYYNFVLCQNKDARGIPDNWKSCAEKTGIDVEKMQACYEGSEGKKLLVDSFTASAKAGAQGSPTIKINGKDYNGQRDSDSLFNALCRGFGETKPEACADVPPPVIVGITVVNDKNCENCDSTQIESALERVFGDVKFTQVDATSEEGKQLVEQYGIEVVPSFIIDNNVEKNDVWSQPNLQAAFEKKGDSYKLLDQATGATYYLDEEKRAEYEAEVAAAKQKALESLEMEEGDNKPQIDFFVMSYCPYGNQAEEMIKPVYDSLGDNAIFNPRYVIYSNYQGGGPQYCRSEGKYCSMHGIQELNQNVREICVNKNYGIKEWFDFAIAMNEQCNAGNADTCWKKVAESLDLDTAKISACEKNEADTLLAKEKELNDLLSVSGSPTIFVEAEAYEGARTAAGIQQALCSAYDGKKPAKCANVPVETTSGATVPTGGCG